MEAKEKNVKIVQKTERYYEADDVAKIAGDLIPQYHQHLQNVPILYYFDTGRMKDAATMAKRSEKEIFISGYKFAVQVSKRQWDELNDKQKVALVDHELCHAYVSPEGDLEIIDHDIEEFSVIVNRHGIWNDRLKHFAPIASEQLEIFAQKAKAA